MRASEADAPAAPCVIVDAHGIGTPAAQALLDARVREGLTGGAPAVVVLCAAGEPLLTARAQLRSLDSMLAPAAAALGARVSRSATDGLAAWAASVHRPIGVDVQSAPARLDSALIDAALHPDEQRWLALQPDQGLAFARLWAGKESVLKAFGVGLAWHANTVCVLPVSSAWQRLEIAALGGVWLSAPAHSPAQQGRWPAALAIALNAGQPGPRRSS